MSFVILGFVSINPIILQTKLFYNIPCYVTVRFAFLLQVAARAEVCCAAGPAAADAALDRAAAQHRLNYHGDVPVRQHLAKGLRLGSNGTSRRDAR